ncbi:MAG: hypothetical protein Q8Q23_03755 [bacterium]|nr:hypothetical protein [bacterium]
MEYINIWTILTTISIISLLLFWGKRNAVSGSFTGGIIVGLIISLVIMFRGNGFDWVVVGKAAIIGAIAGIVVELLGRAGDRLKK